MMRSFPQRWFARALCSALAVAFVLSCTITGFAQAQSNAADLQGFVRDQQGAVVPAANVTARNTGTGLTRTATTNEEGFYQITNLPPGDYEVSVESATFKRALIPNVMLTVGQRADLDVPLEVGGIGETVTVTGATTELVETSRTAVANTIDQQRIENLPINERNYINFALTTSTVTRDNARPIGPAPTSGLNFGGQRGRSNLVQVDGADNTDNSVNASRSTVSQEAVQEFQVVTNSYAPEFGRTSGGVVNVVTKGGTNDIRGNLFGFIRHKSIQARNSFAPIINGDPSEKPPFTRAQYGATIGGPFDRDRTFFFAAHEQRRRQESGFFTSNVGLGLNGSVTIAAPFLPFAQTFNNITPAQATYVSGLLTQAGALIGSGVPANILLGQQLATAAVGYAFLASSGGSTALNGTNPLVSVSGAIPAGQVIGSRFFLSGAPIPFTVNAAGAPVAFRPLRQLPGVFPISEDTDFTSVRLDHMITQKHQMTMRIGYNTSDVSGIQVESQNQALGQNDFSRTGVQTLRDTSFVTSLASTLSNSVVNEARFNFGSRRATFRSQNGDAVAVNIAGTAFFGRELFSPVIRTENRYQFTDNVNVAWGNHTFKFGGDANFISVSALFELNFAGLFNFGGLSATTLSPFPGAPPEFTPVQQYGLGFPTNFIQGFGNPNSALKNRPLAAFAQDSWKVRPNLTLNYGVRYDYEITDQIAPVGFSDPLSRINLSASDLQAAQDAIGVRQGFPRDKNNIAPRAGLAWDITGNGQTVVRASFGIFYDHPLLAIGFNSDIADAAQQQQGVFISGSPAPTALLNATQVFQGTVCTGQGSPICAALPPGFRTPGVAAGSDYQFGRQRFNDQTFPGFGPVLPFTLPVSKSFEYAYANQGNLTLERQLTKNISVSASYLFVGAHHLPHPLDINAPDVNLQIENFRRFANRAPNNTTEVALVNVFPTTGAGSTPGSTFTNPISGETFVTVIPGFIVQGPRGRVISPAAANFFRPNAPNYFLVQALTGLSPAAFNTFLAGTLRTPGVVSPFGSVNTQVSDGNSVYHAGNFELKKRFSNNFQFLASYTWSHAIDDSSDLQTLLLPQDNRNFRAERADSLFDQRHRFVFSGVLAAPPGWRSEGGMRRFLSDFVVAPIFEISSGRPFNILTGVDTNNDQSNQTDRPNVGANGVLTLPPPFTSGNLGRNMGLTDSYASLDMRVMRKVRFGERFNLDVIAEGFNLFNRFNHAASSPLFTDVNQFGGLDGNRYRSRPTAAFDPRQFQFGLKLNF